MRNTGRVFLSVSFFFCFVWSLTGLPRPAAARGVTIAVVRDGPVVERDIVDRIEEELGQLVASGTRVTFKTAPEFDAQWDAGRIRQVIVNAMNDPEVDYVLLAGLLVTEEAGKPDLPLTKPVVYGTARYAGLHDMPYDESSGAAKKNLSFTYIPHGVAREIHDYQDLIPFQSVHIAIDQLYPRELDALSTGLEEFEGILGMPVRTIPVTDNVSQALTALDESVEVILLFYTPRLSREGRVEFIDACTARGIPVFSIVGHPDVELGALAALLPDLRPIVARRAALNLNQLIRGASVDELPTMLPIETSLLVNGRTAAAIGYAPTFEAQVWADFLYPEALVKKETSLTFAEALEEAEKGNTALTIKDADVETVMREKQLALSPLLPQIGATGSYDSYEPGPLEGILPDDQTRAGVSLSQMLYDDRIVSDYRSSKRILESVQHNREAARLDVLSEAGTAFLQFVLARVFYRIEAANVELTKDNLELSKIRYEVGFSGQDEVFRWEAELARRRRTLFEERARIEASRIAFNQVLGIDQDTRWKPEEIEVNADVFYFLDGRIDPIFKDAAALDRFHEFMVQYALENAPELKFIDKAMESEQIQLGQRKRRFFIPTFTASLSYDYFLERNPDIPSGVDKDVVGFQIFASYPIFNGAGRLYDMRRSQSIVEGLRREEKLIGELVERRARTAMRSMENSFPTIKFGQIEAENSNKNLNIVQEKYAEGIVNITDLLEAQNQAFTAEQSEAAAVYAFLIDLVEFQRAISWFEDEKTSQEKEEMVGRIREAALPQ